MSEACYDHSFFEFERIPHAKLAELTLQRMMTCGLAQLQQPSSGVPGEDNFRIVSWVEDPQNKLGHALAVSKPYPAPSHKDLIQSRLYFVDRDQHTLVDPPKLLAVEDTMPATGRRLTERASSLTTEFDHTEFALMLNMLGKVASGFNGDRVPVDRDVFITLADNHLYDLASMFSVSEKNPSAEEGELEHILEWTEFIEAVSKLFKDQADPAEPYREIAFQHEQGAELYAINLCGHYRAVSCIQVLWQDNGNWQGRVYELDPIEDEDDLAGQQPDPTWDRQAILATVRDGLPIPNRLFRQYLGETLGQ
jgi:hypothetical protein